MITNRPVLISPPPGSAVANPHTDIVIALAASSSWHSGLSVWADGIQMINGREVGKGAEINRVWEHGQRIFVSLKRVGGWSSGHVLVQIKNDETGASLNQYFFLANAHIKPPLSRSVGRVAGGYFWQEQDHWHVAGLQVPLPCRMPEGMIVGPGCVYYKHNGMVAWVSNGKWMSTLVPLNLISDLSSLSMAARGDEYALAALDSSGGVTVICNDKLHYWAQANACQVGVTPGWVHVNQYSHSAHIPWGYAPHPLERLSLIHI